jgi:hypothetical protein
MVMSDAVLIALIVAVPPTVAATAALIASLHVGKKADQLTVMVDGRLGELLEAKDQLLAAAKVSSHAEGMKDQRDSEQGE